jgi:DNA polymerase-3 subunit alpha
VSVVIIRDNGAREFEVALPGNFRLTRELAGGVKALDGVIDVALT